MSTKYLCIDKNNILKSISDRYYTYEFNPTSTEYKVDTNRKLVTVGCENLKYSDLNTKMMYKSDDSLIKLKGKYKLRNRVKINGAYYYIKSSCTKYYKFIFSVFISADAPEMTRVSNDMGEYYIVPVGYPFDKYVEFINKKSNSIYIELTDELADYDYRNVSNIYGMDLYHCNPVNIYTDTTPFNAQNRVYLDEITQIAELIRSISKLYPNIQLYTDASNRVNSKNINEFLYYKSQLYDDESPLSSIVFYDDPKYGRVMRQSITVRFRYETYDIHEYVNRRNEYLMNKFLSDISFIHPKVNGDPLQIGVNWMRDLTEIEPEKIQDTSDRMIYGFSIRCIINGLLLEKVDEPTRIDDVVVYIYPNNGKLLKTEIEEYNRLDIEDLRFSIIGESNIRVEGS